MARVKNSFVALIIILVILGLSASLVKTQAETWKKPNLQMSPLANAAQFAGGNSSSIADGNMYLRDHWYIQSSAKVHVSPQVLTSIPSDSTDWFSTEVPSTVLAALVGDHVYPSPEFGINLRSIPGTGYLDSWMPTRNTELPPGSGKILQSYPPGINFSNVPFPTDSPFKCGWWYRTEFRLPLMWGSKNIWLHFDGINYRANIWLNGHQIANQNQVAGAWRLYRFNITRVVHPAGENILAIEVYPPQADDLAITWIDWTPAPPDRDMGVFRPVYLSASGSVALRYPQVITHFDLPSLAVAHVTIRATLQNATDRPVEGILKGQIGSLRFQKPIHLLAFQKRAICFRPSQFSQLNLLHPLLWWPLDVGPQNLYKLNLELDIGGHVSDQKDVQFGIREITSHIDPAGNRVFEVNGKQILIRGAGWAPDMLLREMPGRTEAELQYVRDMHLNAVRLEGKLETDHFLELCDQYGILVMAGWPCCSHWEKWKEWKLQDYQVAADSERDQIRRLRNHPSVFDWLYGSDGPPPPQVERIYLHVIHKYHWPNPYQSSSAAEPTMYMGATGFKGIDDGHWGPYNYVPPDYWYLDHTRGGAWGFNTETSPGPAVPPVESLQRFLPPQKLWPINEYWTLHADGEVGRNLIVYTKALEARYGPAKDVTDYAEKSQLMAYEAERAMFEAYGRNKYISTGVIQWMLNNAWPSVVWHLFDYYLRPGGGYFGTKKACEPLHVQYSYDDQSVVVVNSFNRPWSGLIVEANVYNIDLTRKFSSIKSVSVGEDSSTKALVIPKLEGLTPTYFVNLTLRDAEGKLQSTNFYWLSTKPDVLDWNSPRRYYTPEKFYADFTELQSLPKITLKVESSTEDQGQDDVTRVTLTNPSSSLAFFVHLRVLRSSDGTEVLPALWQDNYIELMPSEKKQIQAVYAQKYLCGAAPIVAVDGWNVATTKQASILQ